VFQTFIDKKNVGKFSLDAIFRLKASFPGRKAHSSLLESLGLKRIFRIGNVSLKAFEIMLCNFSLIGEMADGVTQKFVNVLSGSLDPKRRSVG
jgi:hypothetical protein